MPVKMRNAKARSHRITPDAVDAYKAGDYNALHQALGLRPWEVSPLPLRVTPLGCDQHPPPARERGHSWFETWEQAQELQRLLRATVISARKK